MKNQHFIIRAFVIELLYISYIVCEVYHIIPSLDSSCYAQQSCLTLNELLPELLKKNTTLWFLPGNHRLTLHLHVSDVNVFCMLSETNNTWIVYDNLASISFTNVDEIRIDNLKFTGQGISDSKPRGPAAAISIHQCASAVINNAIFGHLNRKLIDVNHTSTVSIYKSVFVSNTASNDSNLVHVTGSAISIHQSELSFNVANKGAILGLFNSLTNITESNITCNWAYNGVLHSRNGKVNIDTIWFGNNTYNIYTETTSYRASNSNNVSGDAQIDALIQSFNSSVTLLRNNITCNRGNTGVLWANRSNISVSSTCFLHNTYKRRGIFIQASNFTINNTKIANNTNGYDVMYIVESKVNSHHGLDITGNIAKYNSVKIVNSIATFSGQTQHCSNSRSFSIQASLVSFLGPSSFINGSTSLTESGGAITTTRSIISFVGTATFSGNQAREGGAIWASDSKLRMLDIAEVINNKAACDGGGIYLYQSELSCQKICTISGNVANGKGGGVHAISTLITVGNEWTGTKWTVIRNRSLIIAHNTAESGGGLSFETNSKLYGIGESGYWYDIIFRNNTAQNGTAIFVNDDTTNYATCNSTFRNYSRKTECFVQTPFLVKGNERHPGGSVRFQDHGTGALIYGGLLDRCTISYFADIYYTTYHRSDPVDGLTYLNAVSKQTLTSNITSDAVRICFCSGGEHNCSYHPTQINVVKGEMFNVTLAAVDQVDHPVSATVHVDLKFKNSQLERGQQLKKVSKSCNNLMFNVRSYEEYEELIFWPEDGPCKNVGISTNHIKIEFKKCECPIGFQPSEDESFDCKCECNKSISVYTTNCNISSQTIERQNDLWIDYVNKSNKYGFLIYQCPFDYCHPSSHTININLSDPIGTDAQCALHRTGLLCGRCKSGYSLSLGSSRCMSCPHRWLFVVLLLVKFIAGIVLVAAVLVLNLTVAVGTLNGLIFYANILVANGNTSAPFSAPNFYTVFLNWLNLDIGIDTCYFNGMDAYDRAWLQFVFPFYMIVILLAMVLIIKHSSKVARLIGKGNPVATLATIFLLSYARLLRTIIEVFSYAILTYPDGSHEIVWLPDASVKYLQGKHIPLFLTAAIILTVGLAYTVLLFSWQWLLRAPKIRVFRWSRTGNTKLNLFMEANLAPYKANHRYWTGLLYFVRVIFYLVTALDQSNKNGASLLAIGLVVTGLLLLRVVSDNIYRKKSINYINSFSLVNLVWYCLARLYWKENEQAHKILAKISAILAFIIFLCVLCYHVMHTALEIRYLQNIKVWIEQKMQRKRSNLSWTDHLRVNLLNSEKMEIDTIATAKYTTTVIELTSQHSKSISDEEICDETDKMGGKDSLSGEECLFQNSPHQVKVKEWNDSDRLPESLLQEN